MGIDQIAQERAEQIEKHGRTVEFDTAVNYSKQLSHAAMMLLAVDYEEGIDPKSYPDGWNHELCEKMLNKPYYDRLIIAGALLAAEIDRLNMEDRLREKREIPEPGPQSLDYYSA